MIDSSGTPPRRREMPTESNTRVFVGGALTAFVVGVAAFLLLMSPTGDELIAMTVFLGTTAVASVLVGYGVYRRGWMRRAPRLVWALLGGYVLASVLILANVLITARLMFLSEHDLLLSTVLLLFANLIALSLGYLMSSAVARAVGTLAEAADRVAAGDLDVGVPAEGADEIADLARSFNNMTERLRQAEVERTAMERSRRNLIAAVGHDLRTPLTSIRLILEALGDRVVEDPDTVERYLSTARRQTERLSLLVDDLFTLAQLDAGGVELDIRPNSLSDLVSDAIESFGVQAEHAQVTLEGPEPHGADVADVDAHYLNRALANLIDNALRHTPAGGTVRVATSTDDGATRIEVADTGPGIPGEALPHIFDRFHRVERPAADSAGTGLGLAIVKAVAEAHGGSVEVESIEGEGAAFSMILPRSARRTPASSQ